MKCLSTITLLFALLSYSSFAQSVPITFNVDLSVQIDNDLFDPQTETVDIAGSFNGWGTTQNQLFDTDNDSIYTITIDGFTVGETIAYKFRYNFEWGGREEFPGTGNNRYYTVKGDSNNILVWYNDELPSTGPPKAVFEVNSTFLFEGSVLNFNNQSFGEITNYEWYFEGGSPSTSIEENPVIRYNNAGTFDVQLIATNPTESDTLLLTDFITVEERNIGEAKWWNERVFYELFVRSFYDSDGDGIGDFRGIIEKMDYLNDGDPLTDSDLGITGLWLMPINPSPSYHGYDVTDYKAINPDYGTMDDFKEFLDLAHDRGIAVIIDFVMNHTSNRHPWFEASQANDPFYRDFYRWSAEHPGINGPWGQNVWHQSGEDFYYGLFWGGMPDLNYDNTAVRDSMFAISDFWMNEIGIDGFRQDAVLYIHEDGDTLKNTQKTLNFWNEFNLNTKAANPDAFNVGEAWEPTETVLKYISNDRLDYAFEFDLANAIVASVINESATQISSQMEYVYNTYPFLQFGTFLTNHDQNRLMSVLEGDVEKNKLAAAMYLTLPGIPYIYYGEEIGQLGVKPDEDIRRPLQWSDELSAGFSTDPSPWRAPYSDFPSKNIEAQQQDPSSLWSAYRDLIKLRTNYTALNQGEYESGLVDDPEIYAYKRGVEQDNGRPWHLYVISNLSSGQKTIDKIAFSQKFAECGAGTQNAFAVEVLYGTNSAEYFQCTETEYHIINSTLEPYSVSIFATGVGGLSTEEDHIPREFDLSQNYPNPFNPSTNILFELPVATDLTLKVYDITGRLIQTLANGQYPQGTHKVMFDASGLSSGIYIYRLETSNSSITKKMTLIK